MNKLFILFPCSPLEGIQRVAEDFKDEMNAAIDAGFKVIFFDHDLLVREGNVKFNQDVPNDDLIILRGWMLTLEQYEKLFRACNGLLINDPQLYESKHYWPKAYEQYQVLRDNSPRCFWTNTKEFSVNHIKQFFGGKPVIVKDHVKSAKGAPNAMFIKNSANKAEVFTVINNMIAERGKLFQRGIVLKEQVDLKRDQDGNTIEFRVFFLDGKPISIESNGCSWDYLRAQMMPKSSIKDKVQVIGAALGKGFYTVDLMLVDDTWMVLECGDGQVSGLAVGANARLFYERLRSELMKGKPKEKELPDDYKVRYDYLYVADGKVVRSDIQGTIRDLRRNLESRGISAKEITTCDIFARAK